MKNCPQTKNLNVLEHGNSVWNYTKTILSKKFDNLKIPNWFKEKFTEICNNVLPINQIKLYNIYHDCGKPYCLEYDENGKKHFPNHAEISSLVFNEIFDNPIVSDLIKWDMCLHTETAEEIKSKNWNVNIAMTLLVTAFAEIHSNAEMFGGIESTSFKIKYKKLNKRGKMLCKQFFSKDNSHKYVYVVTRKDLSNSQKAVQSGHGLIELGKKMSLNEIEHPSVIFLWVKNENQLKNVIERLIDNNINFTTFSEPDVGYELTSVVTQPLEGDKRSVMRKYQLMK